ncbi:hypothetical protein [Streptomyces sp. NPDC000405]|uniref:hypothetical protein n=1 Tax=Streptomyces sp. NPDC000405 TaxID=3161033 RepID=UPI00398D1A11
MKRLNSRLVAALEIPSHGSSVIRAVGQAIEEVRGRPVRLRAVAFPPGVASGLWVNRTTDDIIAYEMHTDLEHQLVIIGHEVWHMFEDHCGPLTAHGPVTSRAQAAKAAHVAQEIVTSIPDTDFSGMPQPQQTDATLHVSLRADATAARQEEQAESFGIRFATHVQATLAEARSSASVEDLAGRIQASMTHRTRRS